MIPLPWTSLCSYSVILGIISCKPILCTLLVHINASFPDKHSNIRLLLIIINNYNYTQTSFSLFSKIAKPVKDRAPYYSIIVICIYRVKNANFL